MTGELSFDPVVLRQYLNHELDEGPQKGTFEVTPIESGRSNETVVVTWNGQKYILRKPPEGESSDSAHNVLREYRIISALEDKPVPTPAAMLSCNDDSVLGTDFYIMEYLEGHIIRGEEPDEFATTDAREQVELELIDTLASIHNVDMEAVGLTDIGHPEGFTKRQVETWSKQLSWALERTGRRDEFKVLNGIDDWLLANVPQDSSTTLVHGDFKIDNVIFGLEAPPEIRGVLDWEMGTYGDPLTDLGWFLLHWHDSGNPILPQVTPPFLEQKGYASREDLIERYEQQSQIEFTNKQFYRALAAYKETAACEVFYARYLDGSENPFHARMKDKVPLLVDRCSRIIEGNESL